MQKPFSEDQAHGMLVGLAVGDALGMAVAGQARGCFAPVTGLGAGGPAEPRAAQWSGAVSMALCLAQMLRSANGWDAEDAMKRFVNWRDFGYLAAPGRHADPDKEMRAALLAFEASGNPYSGGAETEGSAGIVRLAPVVLGYGAVKESAMAVAQLQSRLTHASPICQRAAANLAEVLVTGEHGRLPRPDAPPGAVTGHVRDTLHAVFWAMAQGRTFHDVVLAAVNLGGDACATGAVAGQLAGRVWGYEGIPGDWLEMLWDHDKILVTADDLYAMRPIDQ